jgi:glycosyltransferase involved in cell wall biosynthesis
LSFLQNRPRISIVTPNYNNGVTLGATMASVLDADYPGLEYIVLDGESTDQSVDVIRSREGKLAYWASRSDKGAYAAVNEGFSRSTGEIMSWLNSDDIYFPWTLGVVAEIFSTFPEIEWLTGLPTFYQAHALREVLPMRPYPRDFLACGLFEDRILGFVQQESTFWRRSLWEKAGPLDHSYRYAADFELWTRFAQHAELYAVGTPLASFHIRGRDNRSRANLDTYYREVDDAVVRMTDHLRRARVQYQKQMALYQRSKAVPGIRGLLRRKLRIGHISGALLVWNRDAERYELVERLWLDSH